jgi:hypothetical protein
MICFPRTENINVSMSAILTQAVNGSGGAQLILRRFFSPGIGNECRQPLFNIRLYPGRSPGGDANGHGKSVVADHSVNGRA